jgi:hypothetical protein
MQITETERETQREREIWVKATELRSEALGDFERGMDEKLQNEMAHTQ